MSLDNIISDLSALFKDGIGLYGDFKDGDNEVELGHVGEDLTNILRNELHVPIPAGFEIQSIKFKQK